MKQSDVESGALAPTEAALYAQIQAVLQQARQQAKRLQQEFGRGFSLPNLRNFRQFYLTFSEDEIRYSTSSELTWTHFRVLMRVSDPAARQWYAREAAAQTWSVAGSEQIFASRYQPWLPTEAELQAELTRDRALIENAQASRVSDSSTDGAGA